MILDIVDALVNESQFKINIIVGGPANRAEPYSRGCADRMEHFRHKYPNCFWAAPSEFFMDGSLINRGTDFGLMPSNFEPGGIV